MTGIINSYLGWEYNFYINGAVAVVFAIVCFLVVHDTPEENPRVTNEELKYIFENIIQNEEGSVVQKFPPYWSMIKSVKVWALVRSKLCKLEAIRSFHNNCLFSRLLLSLETSWDTHTSIMDFRCI